MSDLPYIDVIFKLKRYNTVSESAIYDILYVRSLCLLCGKLSKLYHVNVVF